MFRSAKTRIASMIFVGFAWVRGSRTVRLGTIAIDTMRTRHVLPGMPKRNFDRLWRGMVFLRICFLLEFCFQVCIGIPIVLYTVASHSEM